MYTYQYPRPALTVDALVLKKETAEVLLIQREKEPFKNKWALPGGFVDMNELLESACLRELEEETGLKLERVLQFKTYDAIDRDPRSRTISVVFCGFAEKDATVRGGDDASNASWFDLDELPELAFDHATIIADFCSVVGQIKKS